MRFVLVFATFLLGLFLFACQAEQQESKTFSINDFETFLNVNHGDKEEMLPSKLGKFTGGFFLEDSNTFVYQFNTVEKVPISVWVDAKSGLVTTVLIEVLSEVNSMHTQIEKAANEFNLEPFDYQWFGLSIEEIKTKFDMTVSTEHTSENLKSIGYVSSDKKIAVSFSFYAEQDYKCSAVMLHWIYL